TVGDGSLTSHDSTTASITAGPLPARVFSRAKGRLALSSGKGSWTVQIEPVDHAFLITDVDRATVTMRYAGAEVLASAKSTEVAVDADGNGVSEVTAAFARSDLRGLFGTLPRGKTSVTVAVGGRLSGGGEFRGEVAFDVIKPAGEVAASVSPNPLNPTGTIAFYTPKPGPLRVTLYDVTGRLVRTLVDAQNAASGDHELRIDGTGLGGRPLSSGVYFYRVETSAGIATGRFAVLK
ncbi:MAG TPA: T9SS type A sorting domain-containing protein, partial [Candidatus Limnocylindrales bacterium]|nr:T9SS type A sorting domain-containing protein [Candidatus Limnocylindrales bacterium]